MRWLSLLLTAIVAGALGFLAARAQPGTAVDPGPRAGGSRAVAERETRTGAATPGAAGEPTTADGGGGGGGGSHAGAEGRPAARADGIAAGGAAAQDCPARLEHLTAQLAEHERQRRALDGDPIPPRSDTAPRFQEKPLLATFQGAFKATGISGRVDTVDCTEHPCIVYGRVHGDEELVAKLEDSKPFAAYDDDIGVMLTWSSGDHARGHQPKATGERSKPSEISLFAFAFYTPADRARLGDGIDRRIRARTTDLWNALGPDDP